MSKLFGKTTKTTMMGNEAVINKSAVDFSTKELLNGTITKETFLKMGMVELPEVIKANPLMVLALSFNRDSKVGSWTNKAMNICTALPSEFINESGVGASKHFTKAFLCTTKHGKKEHYERIFEDELNVHTFTLKVNDKFEVSAYYVSNKEINMFRDAIAMLNLSTITVEDVKAIQDDLWYLFRAWQESSIDMTKDKEKQYATSMDEILGSIKVRTGVNFQDIRTNEYTLKSVKYNKQVKVEEWPSVEISFAEYDEDNDFCETSLSEMQHNVRITAEKELQIIANAFMNSDITKYEVFNQAACDYPQLAMTVMDIVRIIKDYNNVTREEKRSGKRLTAKDYALLRAILYNDAKELNVAIEDVASVVLGVVGSGGVYSYVNSEGEEVIVVKEFDAATMNKQLYAAELLLNNIMVLEKGILYHSDMIYDEQYILTEIEPYHIFADVENGLYKLEDGNAYDSEDNLLFDSNCEYTGDVLVNDNGVFYLYDPLTEVDDIPYINAVFTDEMIEEDEIPDDQVGCAFEAALKQLIENRGSYVLGGDVIFVDGLDMASVDAGYAIDEEEIIETELTNFYGIGGNRFEKEQEYNRNHKFLLLNYDQIEVEDYVNNITKYC